MARLFSWMVLPLLLVWTGCKEGGKILGKAPSGEVRKILAIRAGDTPPHVVIQGKLIEKCPVAGCWFRVEDDSGVMKVDTKAAGFVVTSLPLQKVVTVAGKVVNEGEETIIQATGLRY